MLADQELESVNGILQWLRLLLVQSAAGIPTEIRVIIATSDGWIILMQPIKFPQANIQYNRPYGMTAEECDPLPACLTGRYEDGLPRIISCFELTPEELVQINQTGKVWLWVTGDAMPPVALTTQDPFTG